MRYVESRVKTEYREETYRFYVTRSLQLAPQQQYLPKSYTELLEPTKIDTRDGIEIVNDTIKNAGLRFN